MEAVFMFRRNDRMTKVKKRWIGMLLVMCMIILQMSQVVMAEDTRNISVSYGSHGNHGMVTYKLNDTGEGISITGSSFTIPANTTSITISITPDTNYRVDSESGIYINGAKTNVNSENKIIYRGIAALSPEANIQVSIEYQEDNGGQQGGDPQGGGQQGGEPQQIATLYLVWDGGNQKITINAPENPQNVFIVPETCDVSTVRVYAVEEAEQVPGQNDLSLNGTNEANKTSNTIRSWHVTDYWQPPILDDDDPMNDHPITDTNVNCSITIIKANANPVSIDFPSGEKSADGWEFGNVQINDLKNATTLDTAAKLETYYENKQIAIVDPTGNGFQKIETFDIPGGAVTTTGTGTDSDPFVITINSDFFDTVNLKVTCNDDAIRYLKVIRKGIEIHLYSSDYSGAGNFSDTLHGTQPGTPIDWTDGTKEKIIATFYYDASKTSIDFEMVATIKYQDGSSITKVIPGTAGVESTCVGNATKGGDYVIWSGETGARPVSVSVTAVSAGSFSKGSGQFAGAKFGSGAGVIWTGDNE